MPRTYKHGRLFDCPHYESVFGARVEAAALHANGGGADLTLDYRELRPEGPAELDLSGARPHERIRGLLVPRRLRFRGAEIIEKTGYFRDFETVEAGESPLTGIWHRRSPRTGAHWILMGDNPDVLVLRARSTAVEEREGAVEPVEIHRPFSRTPPEGPGIVRYAAACHRRFAGDPIAINLGRRRLRNRLFIGGLRHQTEARPDVDAVLNLCEQPSRFTHNQMDRHAEKGEGSMAMTVAEIESEGRWVADRLRAGKRVLVHCAAGMNRSATICCAALILLEGIAAAEALGRVREQHRYAWPDPYHYLALRVLAEK